MGNEFLMPQKYLEQGCGLTVAVCGLDNDTLYDKIVIYIKEREDNKYEVGVDSTNTFKSEKVTFTGLEERRIYHVCAEVWSGEEMQGLGARMVSSVAKENVSLFSFRSSHGAGSKNRPLTLKPIQAREVSHG